MKTGPGALDTAKMGPGARNMKTELVALGTIDNGSRNAKKKTRPDALGTWKLGLTPSVHEN
jgi:hypothetical protein